MKLQDLHPYYIFNQIQYVKPFLNKLRFPKYYQLQLLSTIIKNNKETQFGKNYNFNNINNSDTFNKYLPINSYQDLAPYIEKEKKGIKNNLIKKPIEFYAMTSGTTDHPKFIPHTKSYIEKRQVGWKIFFNRLYELFPTTYSPKGSILSINSKSQDGKTTSGKPFGSVSGKIHDMQAKFIKSTYAVPDEVFELEDYNLKSYLLVLFAVRRNITVFITPNPSSMIQFAKDLNHHFQQVIYDLQTNRIKYLEENKTLTKTEKEKILLKFLNKKKNQELAKQLKQIKYKHQTILPKHVFPNLKGLGCWTNGNVGIYTNKLRKYYPKDANIQEIGYMASEGRFGTINQFTKAKESTLDITTNFYEFIEVDKYDPENKHPKTLCCWELELNKKYYIIITNENGLYRYFIDDIVEVTSYTYNTPNIKFIQKGKYFSSITGEKISEWEIINAINTSKNKIDFDYTTFYAMPNLKGGKVNYNYFIEFTKKPTQSTIKKLEKELDIILKKTNIEYESKRKSNRITPIKVKELPKNSLTTLKHHFGKEIKNKSQVKIPKLIVLEKDKQKLKELKLVS